MSFDSYHGFENGFIHTDGFYVLIDLISDSLNSNRTCRRMSRQKPPTTIVLTGSNINGKEREKVSIIMIYELFGYKSFLVRAREIEIAIILFNFNWISLECWLRHFVVFFFFSSIDNKPSDEEQIFGFSVLFSVNHGIDVLRSEKNSNSLSAQHVFCLYFGAQANKSFHESEKWGGKLWRISQKINNVRLANQMESMYIRVNQNNAIQIN